jgi:hypothetical protein
VLLPELASILKPLIFQFLRLLFQARQYWLSGPQSKSKTLERDDHAILSLTSTPERIKDLSTILKHLAPGFREVHLNLPDRFRNRVEYKHSEIESLQLEIPNLKVFQGGVDIGPGMKLLPTLQRLHFDAKLVLFTIDDDVLLQSECVQKMIDKCKQEQSVITQLVFEPSWQDIKIGMVYGSRGVAYPMSRMSKQVVDDLASILSVKQCAVHDDMAIGLALHKNQIPIVALDCKIETVDLPSAASTESLSYDQAHRMHNRDQECIAAGFQVVSNEKRGVRYL